MRFKKVAVMVMAVSLFMTSFTAGSSYASANETADTQIEGMILKSENVNIEETTVVQSVATSSSISDKSDTKASNKKTTKAKKTTKKRKKKKSMPFACERKQHGFFFSISPPLLHFGLPLP